MRKLIVGVMLVVLACSFALGAMAADKKVVVGCKNFTEEYVVGQLMAQLLEARGFEVELVSDLSSMTMREAIEAGDIDICAEYTGTAWMAHLGRLYEPTGHSDLYYKTKAAEAQNGFIWLQPMWNHNSYALASWSEYAEEHNLKTMSDLAAWYNENDGKVTTFIDFEYSTRPDGLPALEKFYGFHIDPAYLKTGAPGASLMALANHQCDLTMVFATDAAIAKYGWLVYLDDEYFYPPYDLTPYVRAEVLEKYPEVGAILNELVLAFAGGGIPYSDAKLQRAQAAWQGLNMLVDMEKREPDEVAHDWLLTNGLL